MALSQGQWQVRDLVMGPGTAYRVMDDSNAWQLDVRAEQTEPRAWNHGHWSGAEWASERVVPLHLLVDGDDVASWEAAHQELAAAFAPVGDAAETVELRFALGATEYVLFGRPRGVRPDPRLIGTGASFTRAAFVAQDPRIYAGVESSVSTGLPVHSGGMTVPGSATAGSGGLTVPFTVDGVLTGGIASLTNAGTADTGLTVRIDGPVPNPVVVIQRADGLTQQIRFRLELAAGQWLDVDTAARTALLNGLPQANQRGRAVWDIDPYPLVPGTSTLRYLAGGFNETTEIEARWRSAWW